MKRIQILLSAALPALFLLLPVVPAFAEIQVEVSGNGDTSQNTVTVSSDQNTSVSQTNEADVNNSVTSEANTGENNAANNSGATIELSTGDISSQTTLANTLNTASVATPCCESTLDVTIDGNGSDSVNTIHTELTTTTTINVAQIANVTNNINVLANTGNNQANNNQGTVTINTGDIKAKGNLTNMVNLAQVTVEPGAWDIHIINRDNGVESTNVVVVNFVNDLLLWRNEIADINNHVYADLNTGKNVANGNLNDVLIDTGNIDFSFDVVNGPINVGGTDVLCCDDGTPVDSGDSPNPGTNPGLPPSSGGSSPDKNGSSSGNSNGSSKSAGEVLGALTQILPATGASAIHFWIMAVVYLITFLSGLYVRLRAGRSPDVRPAFSGYRLLAY